MTKEEAIDLIKDAGFCILGTTQGQQPRVRPMMPFLSDDNQLLVALLKRSRTIEQVKENPLVELCFVDRKMWYARATGKGAMSDDKEKKQALWDNIPMLRQYFGGPEDPEFNLLVVDIDNIEVMTPHQKEPENISLE